MFNEKRGNGDGFKSDPIEKKESEYFNYKIMEFSIVMNKKHD